MKKTLIYSFFAGAVVLGLAACEKNNLVIDQDVTPPAFAKFNTLKSTDTSGTYFIRSTQEPFKIPIGVTNVSDKDRTIQISYTSNSAVQGQQFNAPTTFTIPAGKAVDTLVINGLFAGYPDASKVDTVRIKITGGDAAPSLYKSNYRLIMRKYCDVNLADLSATFANSIDLYDGDENGPYTVTVKDITPTSATTATAVVENLGAAVLGVATDPINIVLDWSTPNFKVTIPAGQTIYSGDYYGYGPVAINGKASSFSACEKSLTLTYTLDVAAGSFGTVVSTIK